MKAACFVWLLVFTLLARTAVAHEVGLSRGSYTFRGAELTAELWFSSAEVDVELAERLAERLQVRVGDVSCQQTGQASLRADDGRSSGFRAVFRCPAGSAAARVTIDIFDELPRGHRHLAALSDAAHELLLSDAERQFLVVAGRAITEASGVESCVRFSRLGLEHILTGYDHLLFVLGLVLVRKQGSELVKAISAFTLGHSLTLACAVLRAWTPPARLVEPLIAGSIAFVGFENLRSEQLARRWLVTFGFGLVHGFGFAGALLEAKLPTGRVPAALVGFNSGVELGQILVAGGLVAVLGAVRRWQPPASARRTELLLNRGVLSAGLVWLVIRLGEGYVS
jgi:hydrogenase/urease accessory protein HupE